MAKITLKRTPTILKAPNTGLDTVWNTIKKGIPDVFLKRRFNFITIHYFYIIGMSMFWSVIVWAMGGMRYIDALFFTSGASTQSGLNTVNVNQINTGQQFVLYFLAMLCNPIAINTFVVFIRLYWFERRFKDVVKEVRSMRRTFSRSRSRRTSTQEDTERTLPETGVRGRAIQLLRNTGHKAGAYGHRDQHEKQVYEEKEQQVASSSTSADSSDGPEKPAPRRRSSDASQETRLPQQISPEQHIRFLEKQRDSDGTALHIPSPREFERGGRVESVAQIVHKNDGEAEKTVPPNAQIQQHITFNEPARPQRDQRAVPYPAIEEDQATTMPSSTYDEDRGRSRSRRGSNSFLRSNTGRTLEATPYLSYQPTVGRNSFFVNLTEEQREELGGIEYRALKTLALVNLVYFFGFHLVGILSLLPWIWRDAYYGSIVTSDGQGRTWWGIFTAASAFNDLGFTLTPDSMNSFNTATWPLLIMTYLIIIGNTGFPIMLRFTIWVLSKIVPIGSGIWEELRFLLDHPRRCFTLLFPRAATWWLFAILIILNGVDLLFFVVLDLNDPIVTSLSGWYKFLDGLFQAASTRTAGFSCVNIANLHPGIQVSYLIMMYISVLPIAISMRRTNVYEEKSLGIYAGGDEDIPEGQEPSYVSAHLRKQLSFDLWYIFLGLFIICCAEGGRITDPNEPSFTIFAILFEIVSSYGTVGLSLGYPTIDASFSAEFTTVSKLVIVAMMFRGRHRGLPYELDRAILLPSEGLQKKEAAEAERMVDRARRKSSINSNFNLGSFSVQAGSFRAQPPSRSATEPLTGRSTGFDTSHSQQNNTRDQSTGPPLNISRFDGASDEAFDTEGLARRRTNKSGISIPSMDSAAKSHTSRMRTGLGTAMFNIASAPDAIKEALSPRSSSKSSPSSSKDVDDLKNYSIGDKLKDGKDEKDGHDPVAKGEK